MYKKRFGQNFLINKEISKKIVNLFNISNKNILEIGPGNLALTKLILEKKPNKFIAIEIDKDLKNRYLDQEIDEIIIFENALKFNEKKLFNDQNFSIISNLPFNISAKLLLKWIKIQNNYNCIENMTLMFQKELADRIVAKKNSKQYGRISILSNAFFEIKKKIDVKKNDFYPIPKVDASVLQFTPLKKNKISKNKLNRLEKITLLFFNERRKKNLKKIKKIFSDDIIKKEGFEIFFDLRPEDLDKDIYYKFAEMS
jgi:16S rRNA (adenine1518-N6/adenine1519-N6)-dimethyltransferase